MSNNGDNKFPFTCPKCSQRFSISAPVPGVLNELRVSLAVAPHEKPIRCMNCGQEYMFVAAAAQISWNIMPLSDEQSELLRGSKLIVPDKSLSVIQ